MDFALEPTSPDDNEKLRLNKAAEYSRRWRERHPEKVKEAQRAYRERNGAAMNKRTLRWRRQNPITNKRSKFAASLRKYGITVEDWARAFHAQRGLCAGCLEPLKDGVHTATDHCHATGKFRGLLCIRCNRSIGVLLENVDTLQRLASYLVAHRA